MLTDAIIVGLLKFILHVRPRDLDRAYEAGDIRHISDENASSSLMNYTFNCEVMEVRATALKCIEPRWCDLSYSLRRAR